MAGDEPLAHSQGGGWLGGIDMSTTAAWNSRRLSPEPPAKVYHWRIGRYAVVFSGSWGSTIQHVRALGDGNCLVESQSEADLVMVDCVSSTGSPANMPFTVSVSDKGTPDHGGLVTAMTSSPSPSGRQVIGTSTSSVGGTAVYERTAPGTYLVDLPYLGANGPGHPETYVVTPRFMTSADPWSDPGLMSDILCGTVDKSVISASSGTVRRVKIFCRNNATGLPADTTLNITYTNGTNPLGVGGVGETIMSAPLVSWDGIDNLADYQVRNVIYGASGGASVSRAGKGVYTVRLPHQAWGLSQPSVMVTTDTTALRCFALPIGYPVSVDDPGVDSQRVTVICKDRQQYVDTAFHLQFMIGQ
ncbi:hypothetical protein [Streptomyces sp. NPDC057909]|uniref:hypothetical protein n=1 Tax=Streptomyces sp. NPDC057909 TaxID=3346277 RepID=UPI0036E4142A